MAAKQGERYRVVAPPLPETGRAPRVNGQVSTIDRYTSTFTAPDGTELVVVDLIGDVINASKNVDYPCGKNRDYRHVDWINEHPNRFVLVEAATDPEQKETE